MLKYDCRQGHKENTAEQDEDDGGDDADLGLTDIPFLERGERQQSITAGLRG